LHRCHAGFDRKQRVFSGRDLAEMGAQGLARVSQGALSRCGAGGGGLATPCTYNRHGRDFEWHPARWAPVVMAPHSKLVVKPDFRIKRHGRAAKFGVPAPKNWVSGEHVGALAMSEAGMDQARTVVSMASSQCGVRRRSIIRSQWPGPKMWDHGMVRDGGCIRGVHPRNGYVKAGPPAASDARIYVERGTAGFRPPRSSDKLGCAARARVSCVLFQDCPVPAAKPCGVR